MENLLKNYSPLNDFINQLTTIIEEEENNKDKESIILEKGSNLLKTLIKTNSWLPEKYKTESIDNYKQYLLYIDPLERFSIVSFVWNINQQTPIHNHNCWGLIGMLQGSEISTNYKYDMNRILIKDGIDSILNEGDVDCVSPAIGDIHQVKNNELNQKSISIHVYGCDIGKMSRFTYNINENTTNTFISGYSIM